MAEESPSFADETHFLQLLQMFLDGDATDEQILELNQVLRDNPGRREFFAAYCFQASMMMESLRDRIMELPVDAPASAAPAARFAPRAQQAARWAITGSRRWWSVAAIALLVIGIWGWQRWANRPTGALAAITDAHWASATQLKVGSAIPRGRMALATGTAEFTLSSGAQVVVQAPVEFEVQSARKLIVYRGRLTAHVPARAAGFAVQTPQATLVDLGTEFGVQVSSGLSTYFEVFEGKVRVRPNAAPDDSGQEMFASQAAEADSDSTPVRLVPTRTVAFVRPDPLGASERLLQTSNSLSAALAHDPSLLAHYTFDDEDEAANTLRNHAPLTTGKFDGQIQHAAWGFGRYLGKRALCFDGQDSKVLVDIPVTMHAFTLAAWVNLDNWNHAYNGLLLSDGESTLQAVHWEIYRSGGAKLGVANFSRKSNHINFVPIDATPSLGASAQHQWVCIAAVFDPAHSQVLHFVNGQLTAKMVIPTVSGATIGTAEIGNWDDLGTGQKTRGLSGRIDELAIFSRALSPQEIATMYEPANPTTQPAITK